MLFRASVGEGSARRFRVWGEIESLGLRIWGLREGGERLHGTPEPQNPNARLQSPEARSPVFRAPKKHISKN